MDKETESLALAEFSEWYDRYDILSPCTEEQEAEHGKTWVAACKWMEARGRTSGWQGADDLREADVVTKYWNEFYADKHCTLCGNKGWINTTGTKTPAGVAVGRVNYCICPNGQALRQHKIRLKNQLIPGS